jgi:hypothetical protein
MVNPLFLFKNPEHLDICGITTADNTPGIIAALRLGISSNNTFQSDELTAESYNVLDI